MRKPVVAVVTAVGTLATVLAAAGCTDSSSSANGGVFTTIDGNHPINVNAPINPYNQASNTFVGYNTMQLGWAKNSKTDPNAFYPGLAKSWTESPDHLKLTVKLQPKAKWSDGKDVTAEDVKTSAAMSFTQGGGAFAVSPGAAGGLGDIKVVDSKTIEFDQAPGSANNSFLRNILAMNVIPKSVYGPQMPADVWTTIKTATDPKADKAAQTKAQNAITSLGKKLVDFGPKKDVSAGPFVLERVNPGEAVLKKNKYFFNAGEIGPQQVVLKNYSGNEQIWNYLIAGQLDAAPYTSTPTNVVNKILDHKGNETIKGFSPVAASLAFNQKYKPLDNVHVRRALAYVIDRKLTTKIGEAESGTAAQTTTGLVGDAANAWLGADGVNKLNQYPHDAAKAEQELKAAGLTKSGKTWMYKGKPFTLNIQAPTGFSDWIAGSKSISSQLTDFGITSSVKTSADYATYLSEIAEGKYQVGFWLTALGPSTYNAYARLYGPSNGWTQFGAQVKHSPAGKDGNWMGATETANVPGLGTVNPGDLTNQLSQADEAKQKELVAKLAQYSNDQLPAIQIWDYVNVQFANTTRFTNFPKTDSDVLRLSPGVWMQLGYVKKK
ncbi:MAG TPA: ABC transporter substrate-binding protein [Actinocatenispora sp.]